ncbi:MAG: RNA methyltransferase [Bacteroidales bacterium]|nr:RNA methyltransferase [Bacteroidales bacterium]
MAERITSGQNPKVKELLALQEKSKLRREKGLFVLEGRRELEHALEAGFRIDTLFICPEILELTAETPLLCKVLRPLGFARDDKFVISSESSVISSESSVISSESSVISSERSESRNLSYFEVSPAVYSKIAYREGTEGIIAEMVTPERNLDSLSLPENPLVMVLESVEKPGNLGAVLRSADAAGAGAVIVCDPLTDLFNPNLIRASIGAVFTVPVVTATSEEAIKYLKNKGIRILTAQLQDSVLYYNSDMSRGVALVMGTEATGLSDAWRQAADEHIRIPMLGRLDSLNVSVSAAILLFEAVRQRQSSVIQSTNSVISSTNSVISSERSESRNL